MEIIKNDTCIPSPLLFTLSSWSPISPCKTKTLSYMLVREMSCLALSLVHKLVLLIFPFQFV